MARNISFIKLIIRITFSSFMIALLSGCYVFGGVFGVHKQKSFAELAKEARESGDHVAAIEYYKKHFVSRLEAKDKLPDENPYFYYVLIGDSYRLLDEIEQALAAYETAERNGVELSLVGDRYRLVARWYEDRAEFKEAFQVLEEHRNLDPLSFDIAIDALHKKFVAAEQQKH